MIFTTSDQGSAPLHTPWVRGELSGIDIPADGAALLGAGPDFLNRAFHQSGALPADNSVSRIVDARPFVGGGTGSKLVLTVAYEKPDPRLPTRLFIKFSRNFSDELRDRARFMMVSEARFAVLSRGADFPVTVPNCLFADVEPTSGTGLIISEQIAFGRGGVEPLYPKCLDYRVPEPLAHYRVILQALARLAGAHRRGALAPAFDRYFPHDPTQAAAALTIRSSADKLLARAGRMFDFIHRHPQLFPANIRTPEFRQQFLGDIPAVLAAEQSIKTLLTGQPAFTALCHWNANIDNCWFWRDAAGTLHCGLLDWAMVGQMSVAQAISGAISGAEKEIWDNHLDELLTVFIDEYAAQGGPRLDLEELRLHVLLLLAVAGVSYYMSAPVAIEREISDLDGVEGYQDECFAEAENARIQLHMMTKLLNVWQTRRLGDVIHQLVS